MHPIRVGIINAILPGLGYLLLGRRLLFGWLIFAGTILLIIASFVEPAANDLLLSTTFEGRILEAFFMGVWAIAFGVDAYNEARVK
ncbi:MAG: hypothetical protein Q7S01_01420 [bacterium]|nr:hypothetical protein [bacterium]